MTQVTVLGLEFLKQAIASADVAGLAPYDAAKRAYGPFLVIYRAEDPAGHVSEPLARQVWVDTACQAPERWCASLGVCSFGGVCVPLAAFQTGTTVTAVPYQPNPDVTPPVLTPLGGPPANILSVSPAGQRLVMVTTVTVGAPYEELGASASDDRDGDLTGQVSVYAPRAVMTDAPTPATQPFLVLYNVQDAAGALRLR